MVNSDAKKRKIQKIRPIKNKRKENDLSEIDGNLTECSGFLWCCKDKGRKKLDCLWQLVKMHVNLMSNKGR